MLICGVPWAAQEPAIDPFLALGIRQYGDGDFEAALFTLDSAARKLSSQPGQSKEAARAYLYLGAAYVGLDHEDAARGKFREALRLDPEIRPSPDQFPARVMQVFQTQLLQRTAAEKKRGAKKFLIIGAVAAGGAVAAAAATSKPSLPPNRPPAASINVTPTGQVLTNVTNVAFAASASDPDGDALSYTWAFGDGSSASGPNVNHIYASSGAFNVTVTVSDGKGGSVTATASVTARTMDGSWRNTGFGAADNRIHMCVQNGASFDCRATTNICTDCWLEHWFGTLASPRNLSATLELHDPKLIVCTGEVSADLQIVRCQSADGITYQINRQ